MPTFVLDASVALAAVLPDEVHADSAKRLLVRVTTEGVILPTLWRIEVGNILLVHERRNRIAPSETERILTQLGNLPITWDFDGAEQAWEAALVLGRRHRLTLYDALYLELALRRRLPLASFDQALCRAAVGERVEILTGAAA